MGVITNEELERVWEEQGLKHRISRFHGFLVDHGLLPLSVPEDMFTTHIKKDILKAFLVIGVEETADGQQWRPSDGD